MKSDQDIKGEPGRVAVADEVRMDLSPPELLPCQVSAEQFPHEDVMNTKVTIAPVQLIDY